MCTGSVAVGQVSILGPLLSMTYLTVLSIRTLLVGIGGLTSDLIMSEDLAKNPVCMVFPVMASWSYRALAIRSCFVPEGQYRLASVCCDRRCRRRFARLSKRRQGQQGQTVDAKAVFVLESTSRRASSTSCWSSCSSSRSTSTSPSLRGVASGCKPLLVFSWVMMPRPVDPASRCPIVPAADLPS